MADGPLLIIAAGGTGGHMFPAQALAEAMIRKGWRVRLSTDARGARYTGGFPHVVEIVQVSSASFSRGGIAAKLVAPFRIIGGILATTWRMTREKPAIVVGFGGYPTIPALAAAWITRRPRMIHEQNGVLGRVNRVFAPRVQMIACGTWPTDLPANAAPHEHTGNPVRAAVQARAGAAYIAPGPYPMSVLAIGGCQGARILAETVPAAIALLPEEIRQHLRIAQQARPEDQDRVIAAYYEIGVASEVEPFFRERGTACHFTGRGLVCCRYFGDRAALRADPLRRSHRRSPARKFARPGRCRGGAPPERGRIDPRDACRGDLYHPQPA